MPRVADSNRGLVAVVIPCYKVKDHILDVIGGIGSPVDAIYAVDDSCPDGIGKFIEEHSKDPRVKVLYHSVNKGVGGAVITGYRRALEDGACIVIKLDGDSQMDPKLIPSFIEPIASGRADYVKGNRFYHPEGLQDMPAARLFGNAILSMFSKLSSGYWDLFDPTNGFTAIHSRVLRELPLEKLSERYFFESDMLFRLNTIRALVLEVPMKAKYGDETSNLRINQVIGAFLRGHIRNFSKRIAYNYFLRNFSVASIEFVLGVFLFIGGVAVGINAWVDSVVSQVPATSGTVMLAALPVILGIQFLLAFLNYDIQNVPRTPIHSLLRDAAGLC